MAGQPRRTRRAHAEQVVHRDLKPEIVLLPETGGPPKVLDFGLAKLMNAGEGAGTASVGGTIVGSPVYMAPEQLRGAMVDARADVYSLAVMAYEMLTGRLPFGSGSFVDVAIRQAEERPLDDAALPPEVEDVLRRALSVDPARRPATARRSPPSSLAVCESTPQLTRSCGSASSPIGR